MPNLLPTVFIALCALALIATLYWLWQSLREVLVHVVPQGVQFGHVSKERAALLAEKQTLLLALRDLDAEREAGKLGEGDYEDLNARYRGRAREVLRELDAQVAPHRDKARTLLAAASSGATNALTTKKNADAEVPAADASAQRAAASSSCPSCSTANDVDAVFCKKCGTRMQPEAAEPKA